jgi:hypothetical protein
MTVSALAFYAVAVLIVLAAAAAVGLPSLRFAGYAGAAVVVLLAVLDLVTQAYALAVIEIVIPAIAGGVVYLVLNREQYRGLGASTSAGSRWWLGGPVALVSAAVLIGTLAVVGSNWASYTSVSISKPLTQPALVTVFNDRAPYALAIAAALIVVTVATCLVIGRRSEDEQTLDQHLRSRREREERARRRRDDRAQGRRRPAKEDT